MESALSKNEVLALFEESCIKFEKWFELFEEGYFFKNLDAQQDLDDLKRKYDTDEKILQFNEENKGSTTYKEMIEIYENQILYNYVEGNANDIFKDVLKYAKIIADNFDEYGLDKEKFLVRVYNVGVFKRDIDDMANGIVGFFDDDEEEDKPPMPEDHIEPMIDDDELEKYLFG